MRTRLLSAAAALSLLTSVPALAQPAPVGPPFFGPEVHAGAWQNEHAWNDSAAGPDDRSRGSYAYAYREWALRRAQEHVDAATRFDCADLSIDLLCEYAALNRLPLSWRVYYAPEHRFVTVKNTDRQFASPAQFADWSRWFMGAMNLADNTDAISYEEWAAGDMVLMNWNQSDVEPNFPGRTVWHTYLIGVPDQMLFYGNIDGGVPLPVTTTTSPVRLDWVRTHPDRHGSSPRRFMLFRGAVWAPQVKTGEEVVVLASALNLRAGPGTQHAVLARGLAGERYPLLGTDGLWMRLRLADGREVWAHRAFLRQETTWGPAPGPIEPPSEPPAEEPADPAVVASVPGNPGGGLVSALPGN